MLSFLRQRSQSIMIKIILAGVILPFVLFYGFSAYTDKQSLNQGSVSSVNGREIPASIYRMTYEQLMNNYRRQMQGAQVPDFIQKMAEQNALQQLIQRELTIQTAEQNHILVSEKELADFIVKNFSKDGEPFDPVAYRHGFLPSINEKLGINYEDYLRDDLLVNHLISLFANLRLPWALPSNTPVETWEFEKVSIKPSEGQSVDELSKNFTAPKADWKKLSKNLGIEVKKVGPISLAERDTLQTQLPFDEAVKVFQLQPGQALTLAKNVVEAAPTDDNVTVVRLLQKKIDTSTENPDARPIQKEWSFLENWMQRNFAQAKIESKLSEP